MTRFAQALTTKTKALISASLIGFILAFALIASATANSNQTGVCQNETEVALVHQITPEMIHQWHQLRLQHSNPY